MIEVNEFWKSWKNKTILEKRAIKTILKSKELIINSVPKKALVAIYIKGSFTRREMKKESDIDIVPIVSKDKYQRNIFAVNHPELSPAIIVPLSIPEFKSNKLHTSSKRKIDLRAPPDLFLKKINQFKIIYGKPLTVKGFKIRKSRQILKDEIKVLRKGYIVYFEKRQLKFDPLLKEVFWLTEAELEYKCKTWKPTFKGIKQALNDKKDHIIHKAYQLRAKPTKNKKELNKFIKDLKIHLDKLEKET